MNQDAPAAKHSAAALPGIPAPRPGDPAKAAAKHAAGAAPPVVPARAAAPALLKIRDVMWKHVGIMRNGPALTAALEQLRAIALPEPRKLNRMEQELRNLHALAELIARSALAREESRGSHYRSDFPFRNDEVFSKHSAVVRGEEIRFEE